MFSKTFRVEEDQDYGEVGLRPPWIPESNAGTGSLIAHDMFEHSATARHGAAEEELMAIGAAYRIRGENGFFNSPGFIRKSSDVVANDVYAILTDLSREERNTFIAQPRRTYKLKIEGAETTCVSAARKGVQYAINEWRDNFGKEQDVSDNAIINEALAGGYLIAELQAVVSGWMRIGYMNAGRRFPTIDLYSLAYLYEKIGETVNSVLSYSYPGDKIRVSVDLRTFRYTVKNLARLDDW